MHDVRGRAELVAGVRGENISAPIDNLDHITDTYILNWRYWYYWDLLLAGSRGTPLDEDLCFKYVRSIQAILRRLRELGHPDAAAESSLAEAATRLAQGN